MGGSGKGSQTTTTNQSQTYQANPAIQGAANQAISGAQSAASTPFSQPVQPIAGFTPLQQQAFNQYQALQGSAQPYYNQAQNLYSQASQPLSQSAINQYYNPMAANVTAQLQNIYGQQNQQNNASLISAAGGVGADRIAVGQGNLANQQDLAAGQTYANLYQSALQAAQGQQQTELQGASGLQGLGTSVLGANLQGTSALMGAGTTQQAQNQNVLNATYQNQLAQLAYPFQTNQYLAGITGGLAGALGGTTTGSGTQVTTPAQPSLLNQILGIGTAGAGLYGALGGSGSPSYGGGNAFSGDAYGGSSANPLPGLTADDYGAGFADGGEVDSEDAPTMHENSVVPTVQLAQGAGHSGPLTGAMNMNLSPPQSSGASGSSAGSDIANIAKTAAQFLPMLMKRGGKAYPTYDDGGVTMGWGGPQIQPPFPPIGARADDPVPAPASGDMPAVSDEAPPPSQTGAAPTLASPPALSQQPGVPFPNATGQTPLPTTPPPPRPVTRKPAPAASAAGERQETSSGVPVGGDNLPYPNAVNSDWGQNAARSPWLSLVNAGATMAATPGPLGVAIGKGLLAGTKSLEDQRTQGQKETTINQKAQELQETAKEHLKKWNSMTPYERASVAARNRELDQEESGVSGKPGKFTGADYDRAAKFVQSQNPGLPPEQLQPLIDQEVARRRRALAGGTSAAASVNVGSGDTATTAMTDPGAGSRVKGKWYIGPSGQPQQWLG